LLLTSVPSSSPRQLTEEHRRRSLEEETVWLRLRSLTLRLLAALASPGRAPSRQNSDTANENGVANDNGTPSALAGLLAQLQRALQTAARMAEKCTQVVISLL